MTEPLVVEPENEDAVGWDSAEGGGLYSSVADLNNALGGGDPAQILYSGFGVGLDALDAVVNPFDALVTSGLGFLVEHVAILHEPLDALTGDPTQIAAQARTWHNVARELHRIGTDYRGAADGVRGWDGATSEAYRGAVATFTDQLHRAGDDADRLAALVLDTGAMVGAVRALVRDLIIDFVWSLTKWGLVAIASGGTAIAAVIGFVSGEVWLLGITVWRRIDDLHTALEAAGGVAGQLSAALLHTAAQARVAVPAVRNYLRPTADALNLDVPASEFVEYGKQHSGTRENQDGWDVPAPA